MTVRQSISDFSISPSGHRGNYTIQLNLSRRLGVLRNEDSSLLEPKVVETEKV